MPGIKPGMTVSIAPLLCYRSPRLRGRVAASFCEQRVGRFTMTHPASPDHVRVATLPFQERDKKVYSAGFAAASSGPVSACGAAAAVAFAAASALAALS